MGDSPHNFGGRVEARLDERRARNLSLLFDLIFRAGAFALVLGLLLYGPAAFFVVLTWQSPTAFVLLTMLIGIVVPLFLPGLLLNRGVWGQIGVRIMVFPDRLVFLRGKESITYLWGDIQEYYSSGVRTYTTTLLVDTQHQDTSYHYRLVHRAGHRFAFSEKFDSPDARPLGSYIDQGLLERQLPVLRKRFFEDGETLRFGPFVLDKEGLSHKRSFLSWSAVDFVWVEDGKVRVRRPNSTFSWRAVRTENVPNLCLFVALARERLERKEAGDRR